MKNVVRYLSNTILAERMLLFFYLRWLGKAQGPWEGVSFEPNPKCCEGTFSAKIWESSRLNVHGFVNLEDHCPVLKRKGNKKWQKHTGMGAEASEWFICELWSALNHCGSEKYPVLCGFWSRCQQLAAYGLKNPVSSRVIGPGWTKHFQTLFCFVLVLLNLWYLLAIKGELLVGKCIIIFFYPSIWKNARFTQWY